jgi:hypothetical protein
MWTFIIGFIVIVGIIVVVMNRRGSTGASRADDMPSRYTAEGQKHTGGFGGGGFGGDGGAGGGF